jgi:hypothetical protein
MPWNEVLCPFLRRFVLVFFDDIMIYNTSLTEHLQHIRAIFNTQHAHGLFLKRPKCSFAERRVEYLGHFISEAGVAMDPAKIDAVQSWPLLESLRALRRFLGLTG